MRKSVVLSIDTSKTQEISVGLIFDGKTKNKTAVNTWTSQKLLPLIAQILRENKLKLTDLTEIKLCTGPGSYTGLRVGAAVANTLSHILKIPVNGKRDQIVIPRY